MVDPLNIETIAAAMSQLSTDENLRQNYLQRGYEQVKKFTWESAATQLLSAFELILSPIPLRNSTHYPHERILEI